MRKLVTRNLFVALTALVLSPGLAVAFPAYVGIWAGEYPASQSDDNVINGTGSGCQLCHANTGGGQPWNAYGWAVRVERLGGATIQQAIALVEAANSDSDPTGSSNLTEINVSTQPGWTPGAVNTHFFASGATTPNQNPPAAILGDLDPAPPPVPALGLLGQLVLVALAAISGVTVARLRQKA